jgi:hypothetical protein
LRSGSIRRLLDDGHLIRKDLEVERLAEIISPEFPDERLVACYNSQLAEQRRRKRQELLAATQADLEELAASVARPTGQPETAAKIGVRAGKIINHYKVAKHFTLTIRDGYLGWARKEGAIPKEELLDGIYVIRTSEPAERLKAADGVRSYKRLALVEQSFRCLKGIDLLVRPIYHRVADRVRAHMLLCLLAYYVEWHLRQAWETLLFEDEELVVDRKRRDPVAPARASKSVRLKKRTHLTPEGLPVQSFRTLLAHLGTRCQATLILTPLATLKLTPSYTPDKEGLWTSSTPIWSTCMARRRTKRMSQVSTCEPRRRTPGCWNRRSWIGSANCPAKVSGANGLLDSWGSPATRSAVISLEPRSVFKNVPRRVVSTATRSVKCTISSAPLPREMPSSFNRNWPVVGSTWSCGLCNELS